MAVLNPAFEEAIIAAVLQKDSDTLALLFRSDSVSPKFHFWDVPIPEGVTFRVEEPGKPHLGFGINIGGTEKASTIVRLACIMPLIERISRHACSDICLNLGDEGPRGHIAFCSKTAAILVPDCDFIRLRGYNEARSVFYVRPEWQARSNIPFWRGASTGLLKPCEPASALPRAVLCRLGKMRSWDIGFSSIVQYVDPELDSFISGHIPWNLLSNNKYNVDIDGNSSSWSGLFLKLLAGGVVLKVESPYRQWYYDWLRPWVNYVPISSDFGDIDQVVDRLRGDESMAQEIAHNGRQLALSLTYEREMANAEREVLRKILLGPDY